MHYAPLREDRQQRIRRISIDQFYELATGESDGFIKLCSVLGRVIDDVIKDNPNTFGKNTVYSELQALGPDVMKSLFALSFKNYKGFDEFKIY